MPAGAVVAAATSSVLPLLAGVAAVPLAGRALRRRSELAAAERGAAAVGALCGALAGDLRAGRPPHAALGDAIEAAGWPGVPELSGAARLLLSAARFGGDVPQALRAAARLSEGTRGLAAVAACWQVALDGGAGLAAALDRVAAALRAEADQRDDLRAQLAGPRSTAGLLALLPLFGVVLGAGLGARPAHILLHTATGLACLLAGALLEWAGLAWTSRIIRTAESGRPAPRPPAPRGPNDPDRTGGPGGSGGPAGGEGGPGRSGGPGGRDRPDMSGRSEGPGARDTAGGFGPLSRPNGSGGSVGLGRPASSDPLGLRGEADRAGRGGGVSRVGRVGGGGRGERDRVSWGEADRAGRGGGGASRVGHVGLGGRGQGDRGSWGEADGGGRVRRGGWSEAHPVGCGGRPGRDAWRQVGRVGGGDPVGAVVAVGGGWSVHSLGTVVAALAVAGGAVAVAVDGGRQRKGSGGCGWRSVGVVRGGRCPSGGGGV
ncbi:type II secretion system F family protein [Actinacidiphila bryophytorum]|uniref:type II secretion system F family protein n=1 Tax=Actinacidiphila bryophytorum TaxID=1436133 RepID=UPI002AFF6B79|nr:type II secretion system F family protein [Actinacidiphila bryophytorum]